VALRFGCRIVFTVFDVIFQYQAASGPGNQRAAQVTLTPACTGFPASSARPSWPCGAVFGPPAFVSHGG
jgi:hypothetical protein